MKNEAKTIPYKNPKVGEAIYPIPPPVANIGSPNNPSDTYKSAEEKPSIPDEAAKKYITNV